ncbi:MAG: PfkB family carbohydrate kinase [Pseudomonadota bacterium]
MSAGRAGILCVGAAHWDILGRASAPVAVGDDLPGRVEQRPGGVALNIALGLAALGCAAKLCAVVGDDDAGTALIGCAEAAGVDCTHVTRIAGAATNRYLAIEDNTGNLVAAIADTALMEVWSADLTGQLRLAVEGTETLLLEANLPTPVITGLAQRAGEVGVEVVVNPVSPAKAPRLRALFPGTPRLTVVANLAEATAILGSRHQTTAEAAEHLVDLGAEAALVSDGPRPAALATPKDVATLTPPTPEGPFSVTGAGDAMLASFLAFPDRGGSPREALAQALQAANHHMTRHG